MLASNVMKRGVQRGKAPLVGGCGYLPDTVSPPLLPERGPGGEVDALGGCTQCGEVSGTGHYAERRHTTARGCAVNCDQCRGIEAFFDQKVAARELQHDRKRGPRTSTRLLIEALRAQRVKGLSLLDIGGGVGAVQHELLKAGAASATSVDASSAYLGTARQEAERLGLASRVAYHHGDFVALASSLPQADVVTLDRVVCCYHDMASLVSLSSALARRWYGLVYPRDDWWLKAMWRLATPLLGLGMRLRHNPFRAYLHPTREVDAIMQANGFQPAFYRTSGIWQVAVYQRASSG
ncbi:MAG: class I SAM-dependent methyltransferase [Dehalococcoidia bacterium]|nr:class I SAM-dependent methyltransferase [Dehalococcoidia bacterium]